ncbi:hypothetical protein, partial [Pseudomonas meliae]
IISNSPSLPTWHDSNKRVSEKPGAVQIVLKACSHLKLHIKSVSRFKPFHVARAQGADFSPSEICKATLSVEMGRKTKTMKTVQQNPPEIAYRRNDGDSFTYRCKLEGERVIWRTFLSDTGEWGRWRQQYSEGDAMTTYSVSNGKLTIMNDQTDTETFRKSDF